MDWRPQEIKQMKNGNKSKAAKGIGITERMLSHKMKTYGLSSD